jgi:hypothetical protein
MAELGPTTIYGDLVSNNDLYVKGTGGIYLNDTNTQIWEDSSSNMTFKDAVAGTYTLEQLAIRKAFCLENAPTGSVIQWALDTPSGIQINVRCQISGQNPSVEEDLNSSVPRLEDGDEIYVYYDGATWNCITLFQRSQDFDEDITMVKLKYISGIDIGPDLRSAADATNWNINNSVIKAIKIVTFSTNWDLTLYSDTNQVSGMFDSIVVAKGANGDQVILLDLFCSRYIYR